jgi:MtN3 and saliva related transmembrane protein
MDYIAILGFIAGILTTSSFLPQLIKVLKTKSTGDISLLMLLMVSIGFLLWLIYGFFINSMPLKITNLVSLTLVAAIITLKIRYK